MVQDQDVLDTWFSSWLFPFATLGWPDTHEEDVQRDLDYFHPTDVLVSGYDILFFWIARMIMASLHFMGEIPYRDIFITGMIKDKQGRWMSKSLGNGIDPLEMIEQYGADAVRFSLTVLCAQGQDIKLDPSRFEMGRNFANKIWNAFNVFGRFMEDGKDYRRQRSFDELELVEKWMLTRLNRTIEAVEADIQRYRLNEALTKIYTLFWGDYADWYLELIKPPFGEEMDDDTIALAVELYETMVQLLHPFMPFITEALWHRLRPRDEGEACIVSAWPKANKEEANKYDEAMFEWMKSLISGIRNVRSQYRIAPSQKTDAIVVPHDLSMLVFLSEGGNVDAQEAQTRLNRYKQTFIPYAERAAKLNNLRYSDDDNRPPASASVVIGPHQVFVPLTGLIDLEHERERLTREIEQKEKFLTGVQRKLQNEQFVARAPAEVVEKERQKERDASAELHRLRANLEELD